MKQIGHRTTHTTWTASPAPPPLSAALYTPNPGERENIDAEAYELVGWVNLDDMDSMGGGKLYETHSHAGPDGRPAYVRRVQIGSRNDEVAATPATRTVTGLGPDDPMDVRRSEFDASLDRINALENILRPDLVKRGVLSEGAAAKPWKGVDATKPSNLSMHAFQISTDDLIKEALEFCHTELDAFDGIEYDSDSEVGCQRAGIYIRELVGRLHGARQPKPAPTVQAEPRCPKCGAQADEHWDCCEVHAMTAKQPKPAPTVQAPLNGLTGTEYVDLSKAIQTLELKFSTLARIQQHGPLSEPPMSFYDHAFIAAYFDLKPAGYDDITRMQRAHAIAAKLTRNRAVPA